MVFLWKHKTTQLYCFHKYNSIVNLIRGYYAVKTLENLCLYLWAHLSEVRSLDIFYSYFLYFIFTTFTHHFGSATEFRGLDCLIEAHWIHPQIYLLGLNERLLDLHSVAFSYSIDNSSVFLFQINYVPKPSTHRQQVVELWLPPAYNHQQNREKSQILSFQQCC